MWDPNIFFPTPTITYSSILSSTICMEIPRISNNVKTVNK